jgi:hypothetical protein
LQSARHAGSVRIMILCALIDATLKLILRKVPIFKIKMGTFLKINVWGARRTP